MSAYDAVFEVELPPDLFSRDASAAMRAASVLILLLRMYGLRASTFLAVLALSADAALRKSTFDGLDRTLGGYGRMYAFLRDPADAAGAEALNPVVRRVLEVVEADRRDACAAMAAFRGKIEAMNADLRDGSTLPDGAFDALHLYNYREVHPRLVALLGRIEEQSAAARDGAVRDAEAAQARAVGAKDRIEDIARTVRLISLNARVEAARAGDAGRAFGVIAEEIKSLSEQTASASAEMGEGIEAIMTHSRLA